MNTQKPLSANHPFWTRKPQEQDGNYYFCGAMFMTSGVQNSLEHHEIMSIIRDLRRAVKQSEGLDYFQAFTHKDGRKVWVIDNLSKDRLESDDMTDAQKLEHNYFTVLLPEEY